MRPALAGALGGSLSTLVLHPLDLLKTRQAVHGNGDSREMRNVYSRVGSAATHIWKNEGGFRGLYKGVGVNVGLAGASWGITFMR